MKKEVFVILGVDSHLQRIIDCVSSLKSVYGVNIDIGIATFGNAELSPSTKLRNFCESNNYLFYDSPRQKFLTIQKDKRNQGFITTDREFHVCETIGNIVVSKYFYDLGYEEVYLMHNDLFVVRDFLPIYRNHMIDNWAFVAPYTVSVNCYKPDISLIKKTNRADRSDFTMIHGKKIIARITQTILILNKSLVYHLYDKYKSQDLMYQQFFVDINMHGDIALLQLLNDFEGFIGRPISAPIVMDLHCTRNTDISDIINSKDLNHIHGKGLYSKYRNKITKIINLIKNDKNLR